MIFEGLLASVIAPAAVDMIKNLFGAVTKRWVGLSVDEQIKLANADVEKLKALAELDNPYGTPSQWVVDLRASFRYIAAPIVILTGAFVIYLGVQAASMDIMEMGGTLVSMPFGFIFGERMYLSFKGSKSH
jgi:hypothetical protein